MNALADLGSAAWLLARSALTVPDRQRLSAALWTYVWAPLPYLILLGVLVGATFGLPMADLVKMLRAEQVVGKTMSLVIVRELVPILVGVFAAGRISALLAMRLASDEPKSLPAALLSILAAAPVHTVVTTVALWLTVGAILQNGPLIPWPTYLELTMGPPIYDGLWRGVIKTAFFTLLATGAGAAAGSRTFTSEVARVSYAFTAGLLAVLAGAALWSWLD